MFRSLALAALAMLLVGCSSGTSSSGTTTTIAPRPVSYVAVGASESVGVGADVPAEQAWPVVFARTALVPGGRFTNVAVSGATTRQALGRQVAPALAADPQLVTVWLNVNDLIAGVTPEQYRRDLTELVAALRRDGRTTVLLANTPPLEDLPVLGRLRGQPSSLTSLVPGDEEIRQSVRAYNEAIDAVAAESGAIVVDLHQRSLTARSDGESASFISSDGFHPSTAGHAAVAQAFADELARHPELGLAARPLVSSGR